MKLTIFFILLFAWSNAFSQVKTSIIFKEKRVDSINSQIDSILLVGIGSTVTRIFLDDLSQLIKKDLNHYNIVADYLYLGKTKAEGQSRFDTISKKGYGAILFFLPDGESYFDIQGSMNRTTTNSAMGPITTANPFSQIDYQQDFNFQLYITEANMKKVWTASIQVSGDLSKSTNAKKLAALLLSSFKKNKYIK